MATKEALSKYRYVNHFDTSETDVPIEELQWKTIETFCPKDEHWSKSAEVASKSEYPENGREEELVVELALSPEADSVITSQNETNSSVPPLNKRLNNVQIFEESIHSQPPPLPASSPPILNVSKATDSAIDVFDVGSSASICHGDILTNNQNVELDYNKEMFKPVDSGGNFPDSGKETPSVSSVSRQTVTVQDRIAKIQQQLQVWKSCF